MAGGASRRMGRNKALLPWKGTPLAALAASKVMAAAGSAALVGPPEALAGLGYEVIADLYPGQGPLGGVITALRASQADWNLILACDMPLVPVDFLHALLAAAESSGVSCLAACSAPGRLEPLCAVWRREILSDLEELFHNGVRKMETALEAAGAAALSADEPQWFWNLNTPEDWGTHGQPPPPPWET